MPSPWRDGMQWCTGSRPTCATARPNSVHHGGAMRAGSPVGSGCDVVGGDGFGVEEDPVTVFAAVDDVRAVDEGVAIGGEQVEAYPSAGQLARWGLWGCSSQARVRCSGGGSK